MRIYLTGATGRLGGAVFAKLPQAIPIVRKSSESKAKMKNEIVSDFSVESLTKIFKDADVVIHLAGSVDTLNPANLREVNVELTDRIVASTPSKSKIIFASSISVYGKRLAELPANEETKTNPDSDYSRSKYEAEQIVQKHQNHVILRIGTVYGSQFKEYFKIFEMIEKGKMKLIGDGSNHIPFVHVDDVADAICAVADIGIGGSAKSGTYVVAGEALTQKKIIGFAAKSLEIDKTIKQTKNDKYDFGSVSFSFALFATGIRELLSKFGGKRPTLTTEHILVLGSDRVFDCKKAKKELGFSPRSIAQGITELVTIYKKSV
ncbi:NAD(P)-dependent oxidoreductase [Candidatus Micrarchaeota archaeon]|nr:NAD(P)-dependent oxidoreductase [Candidatus Micrarchaeota archaeon]